MSGADRQDWLECGLDVADSATEHVPLHVVALEPAVITVYHHTGSADGGPGHPLSGVAPGGTCGCIVVYPRFSVEHQTWIRALRAGDRLAVRFLIGNNNAYLDDAGLSQDGAWLLIRRPGANREACYHLDSRNGPAFSVSRMIQPITPRAADAGD